MIDTPVLLNADNLERETADLPLALRKALSLGLRIERGRLTVRVPDGRLFLFEGQDQGPDATFIINNPAFARRLAFGGDVGFAEGYLRGEWESPDLTSFLQLFCVNSDIIRTLLDNKPLIQMWQRFRQWLNRNTPRGSRRNIEAHYDLGNAFYEQWLDDTMTYSSAVFSGGENDLSAAQNRKYRELATHIGLEPQRTVLEIGCGWGGFAEFAAREYDAKVTALTISPAQHAYASERIFKAGLADKVTIKLQDYREERGTYDRVASIEMFEAVGEDYWPVFFDSMHDRLKPGGLAGLQIITIQDKYFQDYKREQDFIQRYIFPGGMLPTPTILRQLGERFNLKLTTETVFGEDYARTLAIWRDRFYAAWPKIAPMGFDDRFRRLWEYYFSYCEAGFRAGNIDVRQIVFVRGA